MVTAVPDPSAKPKPSQVGGVVLLGAGLGVFGGGLLLGAGGLSGLGSHAEPTLIEQPTQPFRPSVLNALGYIEPVGEVIRLSVPSAAESSRIEQILVQEGDPVTAGQVVAILDSRDRLQAALEQAQGQLQVAQATLTQIQAGAKQGEIAAQQATIARLQAQIANEIAAQEATVARQQAQLHNAQADFQRFESLYQQGAISASERDQRYLAVESAQRNLEEAAAHLNRIRSTQDPQLNEARATLNRIAEVRPVDVQVAAADVNAKQAAIRQAEANLALAYVRAPIDGRVLKLHARPGEIVSADGILELAQTEQMQVVAEIYESDIGKIQPGQRVQVYSDAMSSSLIGEVSRIGLQVLRQNVINADPSANVDARVVQVWIPLDAESSQRVSGLTNLQVTAEIQIGGQDS
jgi:HlyD family secretion protein